ncbi:MAG: hypothetical protein ABJF04_14620 [Reichenbachiella sp.]|uniref:hypothetical protein n=1 Tax=Reichenbachiella sp. TaxID=2184521 RepID=UPI003265A71A
MNLYLITYSSLYALFSVIGAALIKSAINAYGKLITASDYIQLLLNWKVILGFLIIFGSSLVLFKALSQFEYSKVIPISIGINFILTTTIGYYVFGELLSLVGLVGIFVILIGIILLAFS